MNELVSTSAVIWSTIDSEELLVLTSTICVPFAMNHSRRVGVFLFFPKWWWSHFVNIKEKKKVFSCHSVGVRERMREGYRRAKRQNEEQQTKARHTNERNKERESFAPSVLWRYLNSNHSLLLPCKSLSVYTLKFSIKIKASQTDLHRNKCSKW